MQSRECLSSTFSKSDPLFVVIICRHCPQFLQIEVCAVFDLCGADMILNMQAVETEKPRRIRLDFC